RAQRGTLLAAQRFSQAARHGHRAHRPGDRARQPQAAGDQRTGERMDRGATEGVGVIELGGRTVEYRFARRRRRTLGLSVDAHGLKVVAPLRAPWREIEAFLHDKRRWIAAKLEEWGRVPKPPLLLGMSGESLPLFGVPHALEVSEGRRSVTHEPGRL